MTPDAGGSSLPMFSNLNLSLRERPLSLHVVNSVLFQACGSMEKYRVLMESLPPELGEAFHMRFQGQSCLCYCWMVNRRHSGTVVVFQCVTLCQGQRETFAFGSGHNLALCFQKAPE